MYELYLKEGMSLGGDEKSYQHCALLNILAHWTPQDQTDSVKGERIQNDRNDL